MSLLKGHSEYKKVEVIHNGVRTKRDVMAIEGKQVGDTGGMGSVYETFLFDSRAPLAENVVMKNMNNLTPLEKIPTYVNLAAEARKEVKAVIDGIQFDGSIDRTPLDKAKEEISMILQKATGKKLSRNSPIKMVLNEKYLLYLEARNSRIIMEQQAEGKLQGFMAVKAVSEDGSTLIYENLASEGELISYDRVLEGRAELSPQEFWRSLPEIISSLREAHQSEILHLDIKPHNIILGPDGKVKIIDFGTLLTKEDVSKIKFGVDTMPPAFREEMIKKREPNFVSPTIGDSFIPFTPKYFDIGKVYSIIKSETGLGEIDMHLLRSTIKKDIVESDDAAIRQKFLAPPKLKKLVEDYTSEKISTKEFETGLISLTR